MLINLRNGVIEAGLKKKILLKILTAADACSPHFFWLMGKADKWEAENHLKKFVPTRYLKIHLLIFFGE